VEAAGAVDAKNAPTAPWKTPRTRFPQLPQGPTVNRVLPMLPVNFVTYLPGRSYGLSWLIVFIPLTVVGLMPRSNSWKGAWSMLFVSTVGLPLFLFRPTRAPLRSQHDRRAPLAQNPPRARSPQRLLDRVLASTGLLARCIDGRVHSSDRPSDRWSLCTLAPVHATKTSQGFKMSKKSQKIQQ